MWKRRKEDMPIEQTPEPAGRTGTSAFAPAAEPAPAPRVAPPPKVEARVGQSVVIKGQIFGQEDLWLDGEIEGSIELPENKLVIGKSGKVHADIKAREVDVLGSVRGDIQAREKITIRKDANLVGNLKSATISIEDGAFFKGSIDIVRQTAPAPAKPAASPFPPSQPQQAAASRPGQPAPPAASAGSGGTSGKGGA
jgi:cytoskeletal protein CcmA (bactofilin family)